MSAARQGLPLRVPAFRSCVSCFGLTEDLRIDPSTWVSVMAGGYELGIPRTNLGIALIEPGESKHEGSGFRCLLRGGRAGARGCLGRFDRPTVESIRRWKGDADFP